MKKFLNHVDTLLEESLKGFAKAHADLVELNVNPCFVKRKLSKNPAKAAVISGGGSGHEPLHIGFVGRGMLDAACPGQIFTSPTPDQMLAAARAVENGGGVLFIVKNYAGDVMNFDLAVEMLNCPVKVVLVQDDISLPKEHEIGRRGVAGTVIIEKIVGAAAEEGWDLAALKALGDKVVERTATLGVALNGCHVPALGGPSFKLPEDKIEFGVGIHGEHGRQLMDFSNATEIVKQMAEAIAEELKSEPNQPALLLVNGLGATTSMELYLIYELAYGFFSQRGVRVCRSLVGNYTTALDMPGCSLTLTLLDEELMRLWDAPVCTPALRWGC